MELGKAKEILNKSCNKRGVHFSEEDLPKALNQVFEDSGAGMANEVILAVLEDQFEKFDWAPMCGVAVFDEILGWEEVPRLELLEKATVWIHAHYPGLHDIAEEVYEEIDKNNPEVAAALLREAFENFEFY